ncbi:DUF309 domain-containing protein [Leptolyngbya sp. AN02str]|uniref:DUF309 domain-containing protein n=1 Tax=Leptolyngbya sp. AN02str TaxID=3423363 RepID=UPI003D31649A
MAEESVAPEFWVGVDEFNQRQYYACHDTLEAIWIEALEPQRTLYQGILQMAVALYHLGNGNWRGAVILLGEGMNRLRRIDAGLANIDLDLLLEEGSYLMQALQQTGPEDAIALWQYLTGEPMDEERVHALMEKTVLPSLPLIRQRTES